MQTACPCGRTATFGVLPYERCCGRYLDDPDTPAPDAAALMRSRYTAYATGRTDYLLATWDDVERPRQLRLDPGITWEGLQVLGHRSTGDDLAEVEFIARFRGPGGRRSQVQELSRFVRRSGHWYYQDGDIR